MVNQFDYDLHVFRSPKFQSVVNEAVQFFDTTPLRNLPIGLDFPGAGVYALYYLGDSELYAELARENSLECVQPIYVGKAVSPGWRTGRVWSVDSASLRGRLREHVRSIEQVDNLAVSHFKCRFMILTGIESDLVVPIEAELIRHYKPLWNKVVDGFGNHDPGKGRYNQAPSEWDILHPGRTWVMRLSGIAPDLQRIILKVRLHLSELGFS